MNLYLSATGISTFLTCPAKFNYRQKWNLKAQPENLGLIVHAAMEKRKEPEGAQAKKFYKQLNELLQVNQIRITKREEKQRFEIIPGVMFTRILDGIGTEKGSPIIVDYKTADWPWLEMYGHAPQAQGIQAASYLYPDPTAKKTARLTSKIIFLVVNAHGSPRSFRYTVKPDDFKNLVDCIKLIQLSVEHDLFPYNKGKMCKWCDWSAMCFKAAGWRDLYISKERKDEDNPPPED